MERQGEGQQVSERRGGDARRRQGTGWLGSGCDGEEDTKASEFPAPPLPWAPLLALGGRGASAPRLGLRECPEPGTAAGELASSWVHLPLRATSPGRGLSTAGGWAAGQGHRCDPGDFLL